MSAVVRKNEDGYAFKCPGCGYHHTVPTDGPRAWGFNKNLERPTFTPSLLVRSKRWDEKADVWNDTVCHSYITDGRIQFLDDCTHALKGTTVDLPKLEVLT